MANNRNLLTEKEINQSIKQNGLSVFHMIRYEQIQSEKMRQKRKVQQQQSTQASASLISDGHYLSLDLELEQEPRESKRGSAKVYSEQPSELQVPLLSESADAPIEPEPEMSGCDKWHSDFRHIMTPTDKALKWSESIWKRSFKRDLRNERSTLKCIDACCCKGPICLFSLFNGTAATIGATGCFVKKSIQQCASKSSAAEPASPPRIEMM